MSNPIEDFIPAAAGTSAGNFDDIIAATWSRPPATIPTDTAASRLPGISSGLEPVPAAAAAAADGPGPVTDNGLKARNTMQAPAEWGTSHHTVELIASGGFQDPDSHVAQQQSRQERPRESHNLPSPDMLRRAERFQDPDSHVAQQQSRQERPRESHNLPSPDMLLRTERDAVQRFAKQPEAGLINGLPDDEGVDTILRANALRLTNTERQVLDNLLQGLRAGNSQTLQAAMVALRQHTGTYTLGGPALNALISVLARSGYAVENHSVRTRDGAQTSQLEFLPYRGNNGPSFALSYITQGGLSLSPTSSFSIVINTASVGRPGQ